MIRKTLLVAGAFALVVTSGLQSVHAAPLTWFPGSALNWPTSGAATVFSSGLGNILIGGQSFYYPVSYPENLVATNTSDYWSILPGMSGVSVGGGAVNTGDTILVYGGYDETTNITSVVIAYSPSGDSTTPPASMLNARALFGYCADSGGNAYAIGGLDANGQPLAAVESYNSDSDNWTTLASLPAGRFSFPAVFDHTNQIYIFGGYTDSTSGIETADVYRYSTKTKTWTALASMPVPTAGSAAAMGPDGQIYVVGGASGGVATGAVQVFNPASDSWTISDPLPEPLTNASMGVDTLGHLLVIGGTDTNGNDLTNVWLSQRLGVPDSVPVLTQVPPSTRLVYPAPFASAIAATGNPQPTYSVVSGPAALQVDPDNGSISYTPQPGDIGTNLVTLQAANYAGSTNFTFTLVVAPPPPAAPANLIVLSATDTSVTLAWDPENPLVGPVTYTANLRHASHSPRGSGVTVWYTQIGTNSSVPEITITGLAPGTAQTYYISVIGASGYSSNNAAIGAVTTAPQPPPNARVTSVTSTSVSFAWDPSPGPAQSPNYSAISSYSITHYIPAYGTYSTIPVVSNLLVTSGTVTGLTPGTGEFWVVQSIDAQGFASSPLINILSANNPVPVPPQMNAPTRNPDGTLQISGLQTGSSLETVIVQATTNLNDPNSWTNIGSFLPAANPFTFTDTNAPQFASRYYRVIAP